MSDTPLTDAAMEEISGDLRGAVVRVPFAREIERENAKLREALQRRNRDASVLRKLHEEHLAPAINIELIQAEDATDVLLNS